MENIRSVAAMCGKRVIKYSSPVKPMVNVNITNTSASVEKYMNARAQLMCGLLGITK